MVARWVSEGQHGAMADGDSEKEREVASPRSPACGCRRGREAGGGVLGLSVFG